jgi:chemotaxis family two-component system response regulator Rcp1
MTSLTAMPEVLLVDDNPADIDLTSEALVRSKRRLHISSVNDGSEAILFLRREGKYSEAPFPDLMVLDLNLPKRTGREVLSDVKGNAAFASIPVVIFSTSQAASDIAGSYKLGANCYLSKPSTLPDFLAAVQAMADFWLCFASLPVKEKR